MNEVPQTEKKAVKKTKVSTDQAESEFEALSEAWDLFTDEEDMTPDDLEGFLIQKSRIVQRIKQGRATADLENETLTLNLRKEVDGISKVTFREPLGAAWSKLGDGASRKNANSILQVNKFLTEATDVPMSAFPKMKGSDYKFCNAVALLFLGS